MVLLLLSIIYLAFISLGLPDGLLGAAWPAIESNLSISYAYMGIISMVISAGTIVSSLCSDKLTKRFGSGLVTAISVLLTALALLGFSISSEFYMLVLFAIPYGLGAGGVDASLNNYVALHYKSHHMSFLHAMWGIGASTGPYIMSYALTNSNWHNGYLYVGILQIVLTFILLISLPLWKKRTDEEVEVKSLSIKAIFKIKGVKELLVMFFCYCALEQTAGPWATNYLVERFKITKEVAASYASMFYLGITGGRIISGFMTKIFNDKKMIYLGQILVLFGISLIFLPIGLISSIIGLVIIGLGCAPIYPCIIHSTPELFGRDKSQSIIGVEMASAYIGTLVMPALFGLIADNITIYLYPFYLLIFLLLMIFMHICLRKKCVIE